MNRQDFEALCKQDIEWERFRKECMEDDSDVSLCDRLIGMLPENLIQFAFQEWKEKGKILKDEVCAKETVVELTPITIAEAAKSLSEPTPFWWSDGDRE